MAKDGEMVSGALFYVDENGVKRDEELHTEILSAGEASWHNSEARKLSLERLSKDLAWPVAELSRYI